MDTQKSHFHRNLLITLVVLFVLTLAAFVYAVWVGERANMLGWEMLLNIPILSIPLLLIFGSVYVLLMGWHERSTIGKVSPRLAKIIHWAPRVASLLIILFTGLFSLDVFGTGASTLEVLGAFVMHNIPSLVMLVLLIFAWKRPAVGFVAFLVVAAAFIIFFCAGFLRPVQSAALRPAAPAHRLPLLCRLEMAQNVISSHASLGLLFIGETGSV